MTAVFYISGHGFGHATRDLAVINVVLERQPNARVIVRSSVPRWFLEASAIAPIEIQAADTDTGVAQIDSLHLDEDETARRAAAFYQDFSRRVAEEAATLRRLAATVVIGDIPPLAFAAAHAANVPSIALGNFTWDWIYADYGRFERLAPGVITSIRAAYALATEALRLPFHGGFEPMVAVTRDIPLIARRAGHGRQQVRELLGLAGASPIVLASFGGHGLPLSYDEIARSAPFTLVVTDYEAATARDHTGPLVRLASSQLSALGLTYPDLVAAADVVVTKPGYGIVSECIAQQTALLYTSRGHFAEHEVLVTEMPRLLRCRYIAQEDLLGGRWSDAIDELLRQRLPDERPALTGSAVAADAILAVDSGP